MVNRMVWVNERNIDEFDAIMMRGQLKILQAYTMANAVLFICQQDSKADLLKMVDYIENLEAKKTECTEAIQCSG